MADVPLQYSVSGSANGLVVFGNGGGNSDHQHNAVDATRQNSQENGKREDKEISESRKPCNCKNSKCLKMYCECFKRGEYCQDCNCKDCGNTPENQDDVNNAREEIMSRDPEAFGPIVLPTCYVNELEMTVSPRHKKGCKCKTQCSKAYCVCLQASVGCSDRCKCEDCKNPLGSRGNRHLPVIGGQSNTHAQLPSSYGREGSNLGLSQPTKSYTRNPIPIGPEAVGENIILMPPSLLENNQMNHANINMAGILHTVQVINNSMAFQCPASQQQHSFLNIHNPDPQTVDKWQFGKQ